MASISPSPTLTPDVEDSNSVGAAVWVVLAVYMCLLVAIGIYTYYRNRKQRATLEKHFLANRSLGFFVLAFSTAASLYSGYTVVGVPAESYGYGFFALRWVGSIGVVGVVILLYAPRLQYLSRVRNYVSLLDFVNDRFNSRVLHGLCLLVLGFPTVIYVMAQFVSFANTLSGVAENPVPKWAWGLMLAVLLIVYEIVGGLKAVALTDVLQGTILFLGSMFIFFLTRTEYGGMTTVGENLRTVAPQLTGLMTGGQCLNWMEFYVSIGFSIPFFPHFQSRIMAAATRNSFRYAFMCIAVSPFLTLLPSSFVGLIVRSGGYEVVPNQAFGFFVGRIMEMNTGFNILGSIMIAASVAAIMSTADSLLIAVSHLITIDFMKHAYRLWPSTTPNTDTAQHPQGKYRQTPDQAMSLVSTTTTSMRNRYGMWKDKENEERGLMYTGRAITIIIAGACVPFAAYSVNLSTLIGLQGCVMAQISTVYFFGMYCRHTTALCCIAGICVGVSVAVGMQIHTVTAPTSVSLGLNYATTAVLTIGTYFYKRDYEEKRTYNPSASVTSATKDNGGSASPTTKLGELAPGETWHDRKMAKHPELADRLIGIKLKGVKMREPIHKWYVLLFLASISFAAIPFYTPWDPTTQKPLESNRWGESLVGGFPMWIVFQLVCWAFCSVGGVFVAVFWWRPPASLDEEIKQKEQDAAKRLADLQQGAAVVAVVGQDSPLTPPGQRIHTDSKPGQNPPLAGSHITQSPLPSQQQLPVKFVPQQEAPPPQGFGHQHQMASQQYQGNWHQQTGHQHTHQPYPHPQHQFTPQSPPSGGYTVIQQAPPPPVMQSPDQHFKESVPEQQQAQQQSQQFTKQTHTHVHHTHTHAVQHQQQHEQHQQQHAQHQQAAQVQQHGHPIPLGGGIQDISSLYATSVDNTASPQQSQSFLSPPNSKVAGGAAVQDNMFSSAEGGAFTTCGSTDGEDGPPAFRANWGSPPTGSTQYHGDSEYNTTGTGPR